MRLIDADALKTTCVGITDAQDNFYGSADVVFADDVDNAPTIDPVTHAKWVYNTDDFTPKHRCTNCGYNKPIMAGENVTQEPKNYCPNCGAKMDLKEEQ